MKEVIGFKLLLMKKKFSDDSSRLNNNDDKNGNGNKGKIINGEDRHDEAL